ncbi:hypothetical protein Hamer_G009962, partial [Homarus americanus]
MRLNKYTKGPAAGLLNGTRTFRVNLKNNIPSSVTVGGHSLTFLYAGQRKTCFECGHEECEVARGENMDRMEEIEEVTCIMSPSRNNDDENQVKVKTDGGTNGDISKNSVKKDCTKQNKNNKNQSNLSGQVNSQTENGLECGKGRKDDGKKMDPIGKDDSWWEKVEHVQSWTVRAVSGSKVMLSKRHGKEIAKKEANKGNNSTDEEGKRDAKRKKEISGNLTTRSKNRISKCGSTAEFPDFE